MPQLREGVKSMMNAVTSKLPVSMVNGVSKAFEVFLETTWSACTYGAGHLSGLASHTVRDMEDLFTEAQVALPANLKLVAMKKEVIRTIDSFKVARWWPNSSRSWRTCPPT